VPRGLFLVITVAPTFTTLLVITMLLGSELYDAVVLWICLLHAALVYLFIQAILNVDQGYIV
jgi:hypothetical protein